MYKHDQIYKCCQSLRRSNSCVEVVVFENVEKTFTMSHEGFGVCMESMYSLCIVFSGSPSRVQVYIDSTGSPLGIHWESM